MATTKKNPSRKSDPTREEAIDLLAAKGSRSSLRWSPQERQQFRRAERFLGSGGFEPRAQDDLDLAWYFARGQHHPLRHTTPKQRERWKRIDRALDGRGYNLMLRYTRTGTPDARTLRDEYLRYVQNANLPARMKRQPFRVVKRALLVALLAPPRSGFETVAVRDGSGSTYLVQKADPSDKSIGQLLIEECDVSTWGECRVDARAARIFLERACGMLIPQANALEPLRALEMLESQLATVSRATRPPGGPRASNDSVEEPLLERREAHEALAKVHSGADRCGAAWVKALGLEGHALAVGQWDPSKIVVDPERPTTTVSEIAEWVHRLFGLRAHRWVRDKLIALGCPGAAGKGGAIETAWLKRDFGREFWAAARREKVARDQLQMALSKGGRYGVRHGRKHS